MTTTYHSDEDDTIVEEEDELLSLTREEIQAIFDECKYSYVSYYNPLARQAIKKMSDFLNYTEIVDKK